MSTESEAEFLARQAAEAKAAITVGIERLHETLRDSADITEWTRQYPWTSVGVAAAAGFLAAAALTPSGHDPRKEWKEVVREALREGYVPAGPPGEPAQPQQPGAMHAALGSLFKTVGGALQSSLIAALTAKAQAQPSTDGQPDSSTNGHTAV